ncbi:MAG TPA: PLP-dependent aminotransferase family protein [Clostridiales bacterium]|nr:PLP-dependent aminotransferase family protein [Clostridiales bacterium]
MLTIILSPNSPVPLYEQLYQFIKNEIEANRLQANDKLPSKRSLASHLKISRSTIETAYYQLQAEGYIHSKAGSGFYVEQINEKLNPEKTEPNISYAEYNAPKTYEYEFKTSGIDMNCFPLSTWAKLSREVLSEKKEEILLSSHPQGMYSLREEISRYLYSFRGIQASPEQIIIGAGSEFLISLIIQILGRDKVYGLEDPGYPKMKKIFYSNDVKTIPIGMDELGINIADLQKFNVNVAHVTPSHHFPLGIVMPISRRMDLLNWATQDDNRFILEDDYDSEFRFTGKPIPALQSMDSSGQVVYINTFAKTLAPSLRISYIVLPKKLLKIYYENFMFYSCTVPSFEQFTLYKFMHNGYFERHINRMRNIYRTRRDSLISLLMKSTLADCIEIIGQNAGLHFLMRVNNGMTEQELVDSAKKQDILVHGLSDYYTSTKIKHIKPSVVIGYSTIQTESLEVCVRRLEVSWG